MHRTRQTSSTAFRGLCVVLAATMVSPLLGAPGDVVNVAAPILSGKSPATSDVSAGDSNVSTRTGAFTYSIPIAVPPGRGSATPSLALEYSSQGAIYGGLAAGWSLEVPAIRFDPDQPENEAVANGRRFVSSLSGGQRLVPDLDGVTEQSVTNAYRAIRDPNTRYEQLSTGNGEWRARTPDGTVHYFGYFGNYEAGPGGSVGATHGFWGDFPITSSIDIHGNSVRYFYETVVVNGVYRDFHLVRIEYSHHAAASGHFAEVRFDYNYDPQTSTCSSSSIGIGAKVEAKGLEQVRFKGQRRLKSISTVVDDGSGWRDARRYDLAYKADALSCSADHAPLRLLESVTETAYSADGTARSMPPITMTYNPVALGPLVPVQSSDFDMVNVEGQEPSLGLSGGDRHDGFWSRVRTMPLDYDGDGLQDRLILDEENCGFRWQRNTGTEFEPEAPAYPQSIPLPVPPAWEDARAADPGNVRIECSLTGVMIRNLSTPEYGKPHCGDYGTRLHYHFADINGNGAPELITSIFADSNAYDPNAEINGNPPDLGFPWPTCPGDVTLCRVGASPCDPNLIYCDSSPVPCDSPATTQVDYCLRSGLQTPNGQTGCDVSGHCNYPSPADDVGGALTTMRLATRQTAMGDPCRIACAGDGTSGQSTNEAA